MSREFPGVAIIGTGGVTSGVDAVEMLLAGASAVGVGTATFADPRAPRRIVDELGALVREARRRTHDGSDRQAGVIATVVTRNAQSAAHASTTMRPEVS